MNYTTRKARGIVDHTGRTFGQLTAVIRIAVRGKPTRYECLCSCGRRTVVLGGSLVSGNTKRCGWCWRQAKSQAMSKLMRQKWGKRKEPTCSSG